MNAVDRLLPLLSGVTRAGDNRWKAKCPSHEDSTPSLSIKYENGRALLKCWAGCEAESIVAAVGLGMADLFDETRGRPDAVAEIRMKAEKKFKTWRNKELLKAMLELRRRDKAKLKINDDVRAGKMTEAQAWTRLPSIYDGYRELAERFETLRVGDDVAVMEIYRGDRS